MTLTASGVSTIGDGPVVAEVVKAFVERLGQDVMVQAAGCDTAVDVVVEFRGGGVPPERDVVQPEFARRTVAGGEGCFPVAEVIGHGAQRDERSRVSTMSWTMSRS